MTEIAGLVAGTRSAHCAGVGQITSYRDLTVWKVSMELVDAIYRVTSQFPSSELFGLAAQLRRAAVSIPSNIAEGSRHSRAGYLHRVTIALGEHAELETELLIAERRGFVTPAELRELTELAARVGQLAHALARSLRRLDHP